MNLIVQFRTNPEPIMYDGLMFDDLGDVGDYINQKDDKEGWEEYLKSLDDPQNANVCESCE